MRRETKRELERRFVLAEEDIAPNSIYFAHPIDIYHTDLERDLIRKIGAEFPEYSVENPAKKHHGENYVFWKNATGNGMSYFEKILQSPKLIGEIFLPFEDGKIGAGVYKEIGIFQNLGKMVWEIDRSGIIVPVVAIDESRKLSVEETRTRVYKK